MTIHQAKQDAARRLQAAGLAFSKLTAKTWDFGGLGYGTSIFVTIHGMKPNNKWQEAFADVPKPSQGGYIARLA